MFVKEIMRNVMKDENNFLVLYFLITYSIQLIIIVPGYDWFYNTDSDIRTLYGSILWLIFVVIFALLIMTSHNKEFIQNSFIIWRFYFTSAFGFIIYLILDNTIQDFPLGMLCYIFFVGITPFGELLGFNYLTQSHISTVIDEIPAVLYVIISITLFLICWRRLSSISEKELQ